jgi:hypothetical protein
MKEKFLKFGIFSLVFLLSVSLVLAVVSNYITITGSATVIATTSTTTSTTILSTTTSTITSTTTTISLIPLSLVVTAQVDPIVKGDDQTIINTVTDGSNPIENALVNTTVTYASGYTRKFDGLTNSSGIFNFTWTIGSISTPGIFIVNSTAIKTGYSLGIGSTMFNVT